MANHRDLSKLCPLRRIVRSRRCGHRGHAVLYSNLVGALVDVSFVGDDMENTALGVFFIKTPTILR